MVRRPIHGGRLEWWYLLRRSVDRPSLLWGRGLSRAAWKQLHTSPSFSGLCRFVERGGGCPINWIVFAFMAIAHSGGPSISRLSSSITGAAVTPFWVRRPSDAFIGETVFGHLLGAINVAQV